MIRIEVEDYCQKCLDFNPDVSKPERLYAGTEATHFGDTIIRCEYRKRCSGIRRFLEQWMKEDAVG